MTISFDIPQDIEQQIRADGVDLGRDAKEVYLMEQYRQAKITHRQLEEALGLSFHEAEQLLKRRDMGQDLDIEEFEAGESVLEEGQDEMIAVCDMGPLHYLVLIGCDQILPRIFDRVITGRVIIAREMADPRTPQPVRQWAAHPPPWLEILEPRQVEDIPSLGNPGVRGDGDRAIISLAREVEADVLIMDDRKARREAKKRGIVSLWTLEVLDEAAERGLIDDLSERLEHLVSHTPFYVGEKARAVIDDMNQRDRERKLARTQQPPEHGSAD